MHFHPFRYAQWEYNITARGLADHLSLNFAYFASLSLPHSFNYTHSAQNQITPLILYILAPPNLHGAINYILQLHTHTHTQYSCPFAILCVLCPYSSYKAPAHMSLRFSPLREILYIFLTFKTTKGILRIVVC